MTDRSDPERDPAAPEVDAVPEGVAPGSTVLVATVGDPAPSVPSLQVLSAFADGDDTALVVTTTESAETTVERARAVFEEGARPSLGVVDTVSKQQSVASRYGDVPTVFTPSSSDLERLVVALTELSGEGRPADGDRHLVVRSLTPILEAVATDQVCTVLQQVSGIRTETGLTLLGVDETAHDDATMRALAEQVDGVLWVTRGSDDALELMYRPATRSTV
ncbi:DUF7504 family protein [Halosimplex pelagicum]|uniref:KaiC-like domain-containing protein n=1 Tax=Halosimplex pelagicum TaxID=869886 RepID=A0A7D5TB03_9EURY|nr:hypothetical protein [Halosimplex pelagicum]QLH81709.1 hypothetical protein HZS54_08755 [Halosimplex pelagicum]